MFVEEIIGAFTGQNRRTRHRHTAIGTGVGLLAGLALGILFAPKSGRETREDLAKTVKEGGVKAKELGLKACELGKEYSAVLRDKAVDITAQVAEGVEHLGTMAGNLLADGLKAVDEKKQERALARQARLEERKNS